MADETREARIRTWLAGILDQTGGLEAALDPLDLLAGERDPVADFTEGLGGEGEAARRAIEGLVTGADVAPEDLDGLEAIVLPKYRPVVNIVMDRYSPPPSPWTHLSDDAVRGRLEPVLRGIGRVEVPEHPSLPYAGTGFVVGPGLLMTNRHVAALFARGSGVRDLTFLPGQTAAVDFAREIVHRDPVLFRVVEVAMIHPYWDMALLRIDGDGLADLPVLALQPTDPEALKGTDVVVVGYPGQDLRNDLDLQNRIFGGIYHVKRLQPGRATGRRHIQGVDALTHDASTLGGNSGSAVLSVETGHVVGLHFAGRYLEANYAVPAGELAADPRVVDAGVTFSEPAPASVPSWVAAWEEGPPEVRPVVHTTSATIVAGGMQITLPVEVTVTVQQSEDS